METPDVVRDLPSDSPALLRRPDLAAVPGMPLPGAGPPPVLPPACTRYAALLYALLWYVWYRGSTDGTVVVNITELQNRTNRTRNWVRRGLHTFAAFGFVYVIPTTDADGVDRRRYRHRYCLRVGVRVPPGDQLKALALVARNEEEEGDHKFPAGASWTRTGSHPPPSSPDSDPPAGAPVRASPDSEGSPVAPSDVSDPGGVPAGAPPSSDTERSSAGPVELRQDDPSLAAPASSASRDSERSPAGPVDVRQETVAAGDVLAGRELSPATRAAAEAIAGRLTPEAKRRLVAPMPHPNPDLQGTHPDWRDGEARLVDDAVAAVKMRLGELQVVGVGRIDGEVLERAVDYHEREAARCAIVARLGPDADLETDRFDFVDVKKMLPDLVLPSDPDFKPGRSGWTYSAGCWHAPEPVCGCFSKGVLQDRIGQLAVARYKASLEAQAVSG